MIATIDVVRLIEERRGDAVVVPTAGGSRWWREVTRNESLDLPIVGAMSKASSVALGICLARPDRKVIVIDADGSLLMNLGSLVTIGGQAPKNLCHFVLENGVYATTGGQPIPNAWGFSFAGLAKTSGYASAYDFDDLEDLTTRIDEVMSAEGPVLACVKTEPEVDFVPPRLRPRIQRRTREAIKDVIQALKQ